jgi:hypothetical protein
MTKYKPHITTSVHNELRNIYLWISKKKNKFLGLMRAQIIITRK